VNFPTTEGAIDRTFNFGGSDAFVAKLNATGSVLVYSTFLGSNVFGDERGTGIAVNAAGNAFVTGTTFSTGSGNSWTSTFPRTPGAFDTTPSCSDEVFVARLNPTGTALEYSTLLNALLTYNIVVDAGDNAYVTGGVGSATSFCPSHQFPVTSGAFKTNSVAGEQDAFVTKINAAGSALVYSTRLGADCNTGFSSFERATAIGIDAAGNAYVSGVAGACESAGMPGVQFSNFPTTPGAYDTTFHPGDGGFLTKLNASGSGLIYSTFLREGAVALAVDGSGRVAMTGNSSIANYPPPTPDAFDSTNEGQNGYIALFSASGTNFVYATFIGGAGTIYPYALALDPAQNIYVSGTADTAPTTTCAYKTTPGPALTAFVTKVGTPNALTVASAVSRKTHGAAGTFDIPLPLTGEPGVECRSSGGAHTIVFTLSNSVASGNASVTAGVGAVSGSPVFSCDTMTVNLTGVADGQRITVTLSGVTDSFGQALPDTAISLNMLIGDINSSKFVNASDIGAVKAQSGVPVTAANFRADVVVSGAITASDIGLVKSRSGATVP
jgi:hypothetical protein